MTTLIDVLNTKGLKEATWQLRFCNSIDEQACIEFAEFCAEQVRDVDTAENWQRAKAAGDTWVVGHARDAGRVVEQAKLGELRAAVAAHIVSCWARRAKRGIQQAQAKKFKELFG